MKTGVADILTIETNQNCTYNGYDNFSNPYREVIFFAISSSLYVLDNSTLKVKQRLTFVNRIGLLCQIDKIDIFMTLRQIENCSGSQLFDSKEVFLRYFKTDVDGVALVLQPKL